MTALPPLIDSSGRPLRLDRQLGSGGEGAVFALPGDPSRVAKVYHKPPTPQTAAKLAAMSRLANPGLLKLAAWPTDLLRHARTRDVAGFVMPAVADCQPVQHLYNPVQRLKHFPRAGWTFQVRAAANLAAAFDEVHKTGCLVGDVNQSNALVSAQALVRLIDCDSFQVRANNTSYLCEVGVPHYTPPELQGKPLRGVTRTENHDRFGLAVLIYQLLFVGRHPYAGVYTGPGDPSFEQLIAEFRFAQGDAAKSWGMAPPPHTPTFADIPPDLGALFRRAFERGSDKDARPRAVEWVNALRMLEQEAVECANDSGHKYWRGANGCVWCRLADRGGPEYYFGTNDDAVAFVFDRARMQGVLRRLEMLQRSAFDYSRSMFSPKVKSTAVPIPQLDKLRSETKRLKAKHAKNLEIEEQNYANVMINLARRETQFNNAIANKMREYEERINDRIATLSINARRLIRSKRNISENLYITISAGLLCSIGSYYHNLFLYMGTSLFVPSTFALIYIKLLRNDKTHREIQYLNRDLQQAREEATSMITKLNNEAETKKKSATERLEHLKNRYSQIECEQVVKMHTFIMTLLTNNRRRQEAAEERLRKLESMWITSSDEFNISLRAATNIVNELVLTHATLHDQWQSEVDRLSASLRQIAYRRYMSIHLLSDVNIPNITEYRKNILASHGIYSALDINEVAVSSIRGFGKVLTRILLEWRSRVDGQFRFDPISVISPSDRRKVNAKYHRLQQEIIQKSEQCMASVDALASSCSEFTLRTAPLIYSVVAEIEQLKADHDYLYENLPC